MKRKTIKSLLSVISAILCVTLVFNVFTFAAVAEPEGIAVKDIEINEIRGILKGRQINMTAETEGGTAFASSLLWGTSNSDIISCSKDGTIKGIKSESYADITCKAIYGDAEDTVRVYCVEPVAETESELTSYITTIYAQPGPGNIADIFFDFGSVFYALRMILWAALSLGVLPLPSGTPSLIDKTTVTILGRYGKYCYIKYGEDKYGYIDHTKLVKKIDGFFYLPYTDVDVWGNGLSYTNRIVNLSDFPGAEWEVGDNSVFDFNKNTGQITGRKPGQSTLTATIDGTDYIIYIHSLYQWPQSWTGKALQKTYVYHSTGNTYTESSRPLYVGDEFVVLGDTGGSDGWAYGYYESFGGKLWGYVPISHISTKGTISQYAGLGWVWPVVTPTNSGEANYIISPYGERDEEPTMHKGFDITTGSSGEINGYEVISAFEGEVIYISTNPSNSTGYCVGVKSEATDPVTGEHFVVFYMHLKNLPLVRRGQIVTKGTLLGYVGNTGNSSGSHLHFEANNKGASIGDGSTARQHYAYLINPLFFYLDKTIRINTTSSAETKYFGSYWYGDDLS